jgi:hypothetical protein
LLREGLVKSEEALLGRRLIVAVDIERVAYRTRATSTVEQNRMAALNDVAIAEDAPVDPFPIDDYAILRVGILQHVCGSVSAHACVY